MKRVFLVLIAIIGLENTLISQPAYPPPTGVYCSCGPTTGTGNGSVDPAIAAKPFVKGILVRVTWDLMEPTDDNYNWSLIDGQIAAANYYNKKISLGVGCGIHIPQWVFSAGAQRLVSSVPFADTLAVPWDLTFLNKWTDFITAFGNRYQNDTTIQLIYMTASTGNGFEMQLPFVTTPTLTSVGYTDTQMISSWKTIINAFNIAFPNHYLTNDFHPVNGSNAIADSVYNYAVSTIGKRYGASGWWWTQHNTIVYPSQYAILQNSAVNCIFTGIQMAYSGTKDTAVFGAGGMPAALQLAIDNDVYYWEIWNQDILNPEFEELLTEATSGKAVSISQSLTDNKHINAYPNPVRNYLNIELSEENSFVEVMDWTGRSVFFKPNCSGRIQVDCSRFPGGIYLIRSRKVNGPSLCQKVIISK